MILNPDQSDKELLKMLNEETERYRRQEALASAPSINDHKIYWGTWAKIYVESILKALKAPIISDTSAVLNEQDVPHDDVETLKAEINSMCDTPDANLDWVIDHLTFQGYLSQPEEWKPIETAPADEFIMIKTPLFEAQCFFDTTDNDWFFPRTNDGYIKLPVKPTHWKPSKN
jgi:hypothetical protein